MQNMQTPKVSIIIPSRNEIFLQKTVEDLLAKAEGEIEIICILDGYWPDPIDPFLADKRIRLIHKGTPKGMRAGINSAAAVAKGEYLLKIDAHCMVEPGYDVILSKHYVPQSIMIPRRGRLDAENWKPQDVGKPDIDYEFLSYPDNPTDFGGPSMNGRVWTERILDRKDPKYDIDEMPASQGSCWFMSKDYFNELELMDEENYGTFWCESQELAFKCILSGGKYMVNKKTKYYHLHKGKKYGRGYNLPNPEIKKARNYVMKAFEGEKVWPKQQYPLSYLIEKFMPMPTWDDEKLQALKEREAKVWKR